MLILLALCMLVSCEEFSSPAKKWTVAHEGLFSAHLSPNAERLLISSYAHGASFWNTKKYQRLFNWNHAEGLFTPIFHSALSNNQEVAITADSRDFAAWNTQTGESIGFWSANDEILDIDINQNGEFAAISTKNHKVTIFNLKHGTIISQIVLPSVAEKIKLTASARYLITTGVNLPLQAWDVINKKTLYEINFEHRIEYININEPLNLMIVQPYRQNASIYQLDSGKHTSLPINSI